MSNLMTLSRFSGFSRFRNVYIADLCGRFKICSSNIALNVTSTAVWCIYSLLVWLRVATYRTCPVTHVPNRNGCIFMWILSNRRITDHYTLNEAPIQYVSAFIILPVSFWLINVLWTYYLFSSKVPMNNDSNERTIEHTSWCISMIGKQLKAVFITVRPMSPAVQRQAVPSKQPAHLVPVSPMPVLRTLKQLRLQHFSRSASEQSDAGRRWSLCCVRQQHGRPTVPQLSGWILPRTGGNIDRCLFAMWLQLNWNSDRCSGLRQGLLRLQQHLCLKTTNCCALQSECRY